MLAENIVALRKAKGLTQEELAVRLNVVRQTVSKWEKGLSVPDAEVLGQMAEILEVSVSALLDAPPELQPNQNEVAQQLARISEQLAVKNRRTKLVLKIILGVIIAFIVGNILLLLLSMVSFNAFQADKGVIETYSYRVEE